MNFIDSINNNMYVYSYKTQSTTLIATEHIKITPPTTPWKATSISVTPITHTFYTVHKYIVRPWRSSFSDLFINNITKLSKWLHLSVIIINCLWYFSFYPSFTTFHTIAHTAASSIWNWNPKHSIGAPSPSLDLPYKPSRAMCCLFLPNATTYLSFPTSGGHGMSNSLIIFMFMLYER